MTLAGVRNKNSLFEYSQFYLEAVAQWKGFANKQRGNGRKSKEGENNFIAATEKYYYFFCSGIKRTLGFDSALEI